MGLNDTASAERLHIGFFGIRNAGKSSLVNAVTGQNLSVVSEIRGTTTDPVRKAMELLPLGPVVIIDTPGLDDEGGPRRAAGGKSPPDPGSDRYRRSGHGRLPRRPSAGAGAAPPFCGKKVPFLIACNKRICSQTGRLPAKTHSTPAQ